MKWLFSRLLPVVEASVDGVKSAAAIIDVRIGSAPIDVAREVAQLSEGELGRTIDTTPGAVANFIGIVRAGQPRPSAVPEAEAESADYADQQLVALAIEHYPAMTQASIESMCADASARWPLHRLAVVHRVGTIGVGQPIVFVAAVSAHRAAAFDACEYVVDVLKTEAPFWKKALYADGGHWVEAKATDLQRRQRWSR